MDKTQPIESVADNSETILPDSSNNVETRLEIEPTITRKQETVVWPTWSLLDIPSTYFFFL